LKIDFTQPRRYAYLGTKVLSWLHQQIKINPSILQVAVFFVNISVRRKIAEFNIYKKPEKNDFSYWRNASTKNPYQERIGKHDFKLQKATFDKSIPRTKINLGSDWEKSKVTLQNFYSSLEALLPKNSVPTNQVTLFKNDFKDRLGKLLHQIKGEVKLPHYLKSQVERIIQELEI